MWGPPAVLCNVFRESDGGNEMRVWELLGMVGVVVVVAAMFGVTAYLLMLAF